MADALPAINIDQLTTSVNNAVTAAVNNTLQIQPSVPLVQSLTSSQSLATVATQSVTTLASQPLPNVAPQPLTALAPQPLASIGSQSVTSVAPQPLTALAPQPLTSIGSQSMTSVAPQPLTALAPQPLTSIAPQALTSIAQQPLTSLAPQRLATLAPQPLPALGQTFTPIPPSSMAGAVSNVPASPICSLPVSVAGLPNLSTVPFMLSLHLPDRNTGISDRTTPITLPPGDPNRLTPFAAPFPIPLPIIPTQECRQPTPHFLAPSEGSSIQTTNVLPSLSVSQQNLVNSLANHLIISSSNQQNLAHNLQQSTDTQPGVSMAMNLLGQTTNSESQSSSCVVETAPTNAICTISTNLPHQDSFQALQSSLSPMFQFTNQCTPSTSTSQSQPVLSSVAFSPSDSTNQNLSTRLYMTSPVTVVPVTQEQHDKENQTNLPTSPGPAALALANMSVIDMLLKTHGGDLPPVDKPTSEIKSGLGKTPSISGFYCVECNNTYTEPCKFHTTDYQIVLDVPILSRARASLPTCFTLRESVIQSQSIDSSDLGVFAKEKICLKTQFGPLVGKPGTSDTWQNFSFWKIFYEDQCEVLDLTSENDSNWMMFLKPARNSLEQNMVAFQKDGEIYFVTCKDIEPEQELLFWFAKDYAKLLGLTSKPRRTCTSYCPYCHVCEKVFLDRKTLTKHLKEEHPNSVLRKWACQFCARRFTSSAKLNTHMVGLHMRLKPHLCPHCGKQFADQSNLRQHQLIHTGEKKFRCPECGKMFRQKAHLQSHMLTHTGIKQLQCQFCESRFARSSDLKVHEYQHTQEKVFPCSVCMKVFYKLQNYKKHMKIHNNERNFLCAKCSKTFYTSYHLQRHVKSCLKEAGEVSVSTDADAELFGDLNGDGDVPIDVVSIAHDSSLKLGTETDGAVMCPGMSLRSQKQSFFIK